ncbi:MAG: hypothetical protein HKO10_07045 [Acidimicrobiia bacterium]|nr:hypothetical protein [Acidimicrobiia bacterium]
MRSTRFSFSMAAFVVCVMFVAACSDGSPASDPVAPAVSGGQCGTLVPRTQMATVSLGAGSTSDAIAASRAHPGVIWAVVSDPGGQDLLALSADGAPVAGLSIPAIDAPLEDIAIGPGVGDRDSIYLMANTDTEESLTVSVYRFAEPDLTVTGNVDSETLVFEFSSIPREVNGMLVDPETGDAYFVASGLDGAAVFTAEAPLGSTNELRQVATVSRQVGRLISGADITPDGRTLAIAAGDTVSLWTRSQGESVVGALTGSPCVIDLPGFEAAGGLTFSGQANEFYTLGGGSSPTLLAQRPPADPRRALEASPAVPEPGNLAPVIEVLAPTPELLWRVGDTINLEASISDDQEVNDRELTWVVTLKHCAPEKTCIDRRVMEFSGTEGEFHIDEIGYSLPVSFEIVANYVDSEGVESSQTVEIFPEATSVSLRSDPPGALITVGDESILTPGTARLIIGDSIVVEPQRVHTIDGTEFAFGNWRDGGERVRSVTVGADPIDLEFELVLAASLGPISVVIDTPANNTVVSESPVLISGRAAGGFGRAVDQVKVFLQNRDNDLYWNGERWTEQWSWFDPVGREDWTYTVNLDAGRYVALAFARDTTGGVWEESPQRFFSVRR